MAANPFKLFNHARIPTRKILLVALLAMFAIAVFIVPQNVAAQDTGRDSKTKSAMMLDMVEGARNFVEQTLRKWQDQGLQLPDTAFEKLREANTLADKAHQLYEKQNYEEVSRISIQAMQTYKSVLRTTVVNIPQEQTRESEEELPESRAKEVSLYISRLREYIKRVETIANKLQTEGHDASAIRNSIIAALSHLDRAGQLIAEGNIEEANKESDVAQSLIPKLSENLHNAVRNSKPDKAEAFLSQAMERLVKMEDEITRLPLPEESLHAIRVAFENARHRVAEARDLIRTGHVDIALEKLEDLGHDVRKSADTIGEEKLDRAVDGGKLLLERIRLMESKLQFLGDAPDSLKAKAILNKARSLLDEAKNAFENNDVKLAKAKFSEAKELVDHLPAVFEDEALHQPMADETQLPVIHAMLMEKVAFVEAQVQDNPELQTLLREIKGLLEKAKAEIANGDEDAARADMFETFRLLQRLGVPGLEIVHHEAGDVQVFVRMLQAKIEVLEGEGVDISEAKAMLKQAVDLLERNKSTGHDEIMQREFHEAMMLFEKVNRVVDTKLADIGRGIFEKMRKVEMRLHELEDANVDVSEIRDRLHDVKTLLEEARQNYAEQRIVEALDNMIEAKTLLSEIAKTLEELPAA